MSKKSMLPEEIKPEEHALLKGKKAPKKQIMLLRNATCNSKFKLESNFYSGKVGQ